MFKRKESDLDLAMQDLVAEMRVTDKESEAYQKMAQNYETLAKAKSLEIKEKPRVDKNVVIGGLFGIAQILVIVAYEHGHVLVSKALPFVVKGLRL